MQKLHTTNDSALPLLSPYFMAKMVRERTFDGEDHCRAVERLDSRMQRVCTDVLTNHDHGEPWTRVTAHVCGRSLLGLVSAIEILAATVRTQRKQLERAQRSPRKAGGGSKGVRRSSRIAKKPKAKR